MNQLAGGEFDFEIELFDAYTLVEQTFNVDLDSSNCLVIESAMMKRAQLESAAQLSVDSREHVQVEGGRHAECVVVRSLQNRRVFLEIGAKEKRVACVEYAAKRAEETKRLVSIEVADVGAEKERQRSCAWFLSEL